MKNKKGFTLVELLAVIVILALIMSIAIVSIGGILTSARQSTMKETAVSIINGVRQQATIANELYAGDYYFTSAILEKGAGTAPLGGTYAFASNVGTATGEQCAGGKKIGQTLCRTASAVASCADTSTSFVRVSGSGPFTYSICLAAGSGNKYIDVTLGTESRLLDSNDVSMIK